MATSGAVGMIESGGPIFGFGPGFSRVVGATNVGDVNGVASAGEAVNTDTLILVRRAP